jgi:two-component system response regulator
MTLSKCILLVEDDSAIIELILRSLAPHGMADAVVPLRDGNAALNYLRAQGEFQGLRLQPPAVVLLDLKMSGSSGLEILHEIKDDPELQMLPVVILSASLNEREVTACYRAGANAYVRKPFSFDEFRTVIQQTVLFWMTVNQVAPATASRFSGGPAGNPAVPS